MLLHAADALGGVDPGGSAPYGISRVACFFDQAIEVLIQISRPARAFAPLFTCRLLLRVLDFIRRLAARRQSVADGFTVNLGYGIRC